MAADKPVGESSIEELIEGAGQLAQLSVERVAAATKTIAGQTVTSYEVHVRIGELLSAASRAVASVASLRLQVESMQQYDRVTRKQLDLLADAAVEVNDGGQVRDGD